jgi:ketosteroid isomerase-like protein
VDDDEVIRTLFTTFGTRDIATALPLVDDGIEFWPKIIMAFVGREEPYRGHQGIREYFADLDRIFDEVAIEVDSVRTVSGGAAVFGTTRGTPVGGEPIEVPLMVFARLREGRVVYARSIASLDEIDTD